jgi:hypothetical protein
MTTHTEDKKPEKGITVKELYDHITSQITPEVALMRLLESSLITYEKLKFDENGKAVHPLIIISMATMDMGWNFMVESDRENIEGLVIGTEEYMKRVLPKKTS